jgi:hypothetical protein
MFFLKKQQNSVNFTDNSLDDPLDPVWKLIRKEYPIKKYILREDLNEQIVPQSELILVTLKPGDDFSKIMYSYITFHQIHFHLKNYLLHLKKCYFGYKNEFLDIFQDIFIDNYLIFSELKKYLKGENIHYMNIWLDGFFISLFKKVVNMGDQRKYHRIQPQLFFLIILFLALPRINNEFQEVPFTTMIQFTESTQQNWEKAVSLLSHLEFKSPNSKKNKVIVKDFLMIFMNLDLYFDHRDEMSFDEINTLKCVDFINTLTQKTPDLIDSIIRIRSNFLDDDLKAYRSIGQ